MINRIYCANHLKLSKNPPNNWIDLRIFYVLPCPLSLQCFLTQHVLKTLTELYYKKMQASKVLSYFLILFMGFPKQSICTRGLYSYNSHLHIKEKASLQSLGLLCTHIFDWNWFYPFQLQRSEKELLNICLFTFLSRHCLIINFHSITVKISHS